MRQVRIGRLVAAGVPQLGPLPLVAHGQQPVPHGAGHGNAIVAVLARLVHEMDLRVDARGEVMRVDRGVGVFPVGGVAADDGHEVVLLLVGREGAEPRAVHRREDRPNRRPHLHLVMLQRVLGKAIAERFGRIADVRVEVLLQEDAELIGHAPARVALAVGHVPAVSAQGMGQLRDPQAEVVALGDVGVRVVHQHLQFQLDRSGRRRTGTARDRASTAAPARPTRSSIPAAWLP